MQAVSALIRKIESLQFSFWQGVLTLYGIFFIRTFIENYASSGNLYHLSGIIDVFLHYPLFYYIIVSAAIIIAAIFTGERIEKVSRFVIICSMIIVLPPIIDLLLNWGGQIPYIYMASSAKELWHNYLTYFGGGDIGSGIRIEVAISLAGMVIYVWRKTQKITKAFFGSLLLYTLIFGMITAPSAIFVLQNTFTREYEEVNLRNIRELYFENEPARSVTSSRTTVLEKDQFKYPISKEIQNHFSLTLTIIYLIIEMFLCFLMLYLYSKEKFLAVIRNFRYERVAHYFLMLVLGLGLGISASQEKLFGSLFDILSVMTLFFSFFFAWLFAVWENDEADTAIDQLTNTERPLVRGGFPLEEWGIIKVIFLVLSLAFAFLAGWYTINFIILFLLMYHIYSKPPFRLKSIFGLSSLLVASNALLVAMAGFFLYSNTEGLNAFPGRFALGILFFFTLSQNMKDLKDIQGDKQYGIATLPVLLGEKNGKRAVGALLFLASSLLPLIIGLSMWAVTIGIVAGVTAYALATKKNFKEKPIFFLYFAYAIALFYVR